MVREASILPRPDPGGLPGGDLPHGDASVTFGGGTVQYRKGTRSADRSVPGDRQVEFVAYDEVMELLQGHGVQAVADGEDQVYLELAGNQDVVHLHLASENSQIVPREGASVLRVDRNRLAGAVKHIIHKLHLSQVLLIPVAKWRNVFDAVAFSLADNEDWQAVDTAATVELNTRDPLLCEPGDFHTLNALMEALLQDADRPEQGLHITTTAAPVMVQFVPDGAFRISIGNAVLADEVVETFST